MNSIYSKETVEALNKFAKACNEFIVKIVKVLKPFMQKLSKICQKIIGKAWKCYREAGYPYGRNKEGMLRWWREQIHITRVREAIQRELAWQKTLNRLRDNKALHRTS